MTDEQPLPTPISRRGLLAVGSTALLAGAGVAWWQGRQKNLPEAALQTLWQAEFDTPEGKTMRLMDYKDQPLVINFWATWCTPCIEEMPLLNSFFQQNKSKSWQVLGLAIDQPSAVKRYLALHPVEYPVGFAGLTGTALMQQLGNDQGGLPFTLVLNAQAGLVQRKLGKLSDQDIAGWV
jgi:thiol-disulfide isomerase/thioredoxin